MRKLSYKIYVCMKSRKREGPKAHSLELETRYLSIRVKYGTYVSTGPKEDPQ